MKTYIGNKEVFTQIKSYLLDEGFIVKDAIHIGDDKYEFEENWLDGKLGCHNLHKILAWIKNKKVNYKAEIVGSYCID